MRAAMLKLLVTLGLVTSCSGTNDGTVADSSDETAGAGGALGGGGRAGEGGHTTSGAGGSAATSGTAGSGSGSSGTAATGAAGEAGHAGAAGTPGAGGGPTGTDAGGPPHTIGKCDGLGAIDKFEDITPSSVGVSGNGITKVVADPVHAGTLYVGTDLKGLYKSVDCGATWMKINTGRNAKILDTGTLWFMLLDPVDPSVLYASPLYGSDPSLYKSGNGGVDWDPLFPAGSVIANTVSHDFFQWASMDPTDHGHLVVSFHDNCGGPTGPECLAETKDSGATWRLFKGPLASWGEGVGPLIIGGSTFILGTSQDGIYFTSNSGATWEKVGPGIHGLPYKAANGNYYTGSDYGTLRSPDGHSWSIVPNAPKVFEIIGDGTRMFSSARDVQGAGQPYFTSLETDGSTWKAFASPSMPHGAVSLAYDHDHRVLYSANTSSGLWRLVTR